jgi:hypothetical protein
MKIISSFNSERIMNQSISVFIWDKELKFLPWDDFATE